MPKFARFLEETLRNAISYSPAVLLQGPRQSGKSTLFNQLSDNLKGTSRLIDLDLAQNLAQAHLNPEPFISNLKERHILVDEVQRAPEIFLPFKVVIDRLRRTEGSESAAGRFLLTGSANIFVLPKLSDSLAGRMQIEILWPLSQGEIRSKKESFIQKIFGEEELPNCEGINKKELLEIICIGGFPEAVTLDNANFRNKFFQSYISTLLLRDIKTVADIQKIDLLPDLLQLMATRVGCLMNISELSRSSGIPQTSLKKYLSAFQAIYLLIKLRAWSGNLGKRFVKANRYYLNDTGLLCNLMELHNESLEINKHLLGPILENFVILEVMKQSSWERPFRFSYYRTSDGYEVDLLLETPHQIVGIEIKATEVLGPSDFKGLNHLKEQLGDKFHRGIVFYTGGTTICWDKKLWGVPISALWEW